MVIYQHDANFVIFGHSLSFLFPYDRDLCAFTWLTVNRKVRANHISALTHDLQTEVIGWHHGGIEATAIIRHRKPHIPVESQSEHRLCSFGMLDNVIECFLRDAVQADLHIWRKSAVSFDIQLDR